MSDLIVATEVAEAEFERFAASFDIDTDLSKLDKEEGEKLAAQKKLIVRAIERGQLVFDDQGLPTYTTRSGEKFKFKMWTGATIMASDGVKDGHGVTKLHRMMADITERDAAAFSKIVGPDYRVLTSLTGLFFTGG